MRDDDLVPRRGLEQRAIERRRRRRHACAQQLRGNRPRTAARRRGTDRRSARRATAAVGTAREQEVSGEIHAADREAGAPRDLEVDDREADRDAGAAIETSLRKLLRGSS